MSAINFAVAAVCLAGVLLAGAVGAEEMKRVCQIAEAVERPAGAPKYSDVTMRSLSRRTASANNPHDTFQAADAFHLTRLEWCYLGCSNADADKAFVDEAHRRGLVFGGTLNSCLPDAPGVREHLKGRVTGKDGELKAAHWMPKWRAWGCANSPEYRKTYMEHARRNIDAGVDILQMDDPRMSVSVGLCYCDHCKAAFEEYVKSGAGDDYAQFQKDSIVRFFADMRKEINEYAGRRVPMSDNNPIGWTNEVDWSGGGFDFIIGEVRGEHATPERLRKNVVITREAGQALIHTMWEEDVAKTRRVFAFLYANGAHLLVPWDVYRGNKPRYFGKPEEYAALTGFVRANARWLDGYEEAAAFGPGIADSRYRTRPPVTTSGGSGQAFAFTRAKPGEPDATVVVHLVDWNLEPKPLRVRLDNERFFGLATPKVSLLVPVPYDSETHVEAQRTKDFSRLSREVEVEATAAEGTTEVSIPALGPWGLLLVSN